MKTEYMLRNITPKCPPFLPVNLELRLSDLDVGMRGTVAENFQLLSTKYFNSSLDEIFHATKNKSDFQIIYGRNQYIDPTDNYRTRYKLTAWNGNTTALKCMIKFI